MKMDQDLFRNVLFHTEKTTPGEIVLGPTYVKSFEREYAIQSREQLAEHVLLQ